jgi:hypothetical protein
MKGRPCCTLRWPGGFWSIREDGHGETMSIRHSLRKVELDGMNDEDLRQLYRLIEDMLMTRKQSMPGKEVVDESHRIRHRAP